MKEILKLALVLPPFVLPGPRDTGMKQCLPHIGLGYLAANVDRDRVETRIYDCVALNMRLGGLVEELRDFRPHVVGFNTSTFKICDTAAAAEAVKKALPGVLTVAGGDHATAVPEETLRKFPSFDLVVYGEGELTLNEALERVMKEGEGADFSGMAGACVRSGGKIIKAPPRPLIKDLDALRPPAFELMPIEKYLGVFTFFFHKRRTLTLSTGRGCAYKCVFCNRTIGESYRPRSVPSVIREMERDIEEFGAREFYITDESILSGSGHAMSFCNAILDRGLQEKASWVCFSRVNEAAPETLKLMKKAGCRLISFGVESGNEKVLGIIKKEISLSQAVSAVRWTKEAGITASTNFILGLPGDTPESVRDTVNFAFRAGAHMASFQLMVPFPGTEVMEMAKRGEGGLKLLSDDYTRFCKQIGGAHELEGISRATLERIQRNAWLRFYLRPSRFYYLLMYVDARMLLLMALHVLSKLLPGRRNKNLLSE